MRRLNSKGIILLFGLVMAAILLVACAGVPQATDVAVSTETAAEPVDCPIVPGPTPCAPADASSTPSQDVATEIPTALPEPSAVMPVANPSPTPDLTGLEVKTTTFTSPDETYQIEITTALPTQQRQIDQYYTRVVLEDVGSQQPRVLEESWRPYALGFPTPTVVLWPASSPYVYLVDYVTPDGCAAFPYYENLRRVHISDLTVDPAASDIQGQFAVSPDESQVATVGRGEVVVRALDSGTEQTATFTAPTGDMWDAGNPHWSPEGDQLVFEIVENICPGLGPTRRGIYLLDVPSMQISTLVDLSENKYQIETWLPDGKIRLNEGADQPTWLLDPASGEITPES